MECVYRSVVFLVIYAFFGLLSGFIQSYHYHCIDAFNNKINNIINLFTAVVYPQFVFNTLQPF